jgi:hypothetical protein
LSNAAVQNDLIANVQLDISTLTSNAAVQAELIANVESNVTVIIANVDVLSNDIANLIANAGSQAESITNIESNIAVIVANVDVLEGTVANVISNVSVITNDIEEIDQLVANIQSNVESQQEQINSLGIFEIAQVESNISILFSVVGTQTGQINELESNAAIQAGQIDELFANAASQATLISSLGDITELENNVETLNNQLNAIGVIGDQLVENDEIIFGNIESLTNNVSALTSTVSENSTQINNLQINVNIQNDLISNVAADIATANIGMKGYVDEQINSNISAIINGAPESLNTLNKLAEALGNDANLSATITNTITAIEGNVSILFANAATQQGNIFILQSAVGSLTANAVTQQTAINGLVSNAGIQSESISVLQGNIVTLTSDIFNLSNVATSGDYSDLINSPTLSNVAISNDFNDLDNIPNLAAIGDFVMGNVEHWTSNVFTFEEAVNQLAERIYNIENPI